jgi:hypothetical protein
VTVEEAQDFREGRRPLEKSASRVRSTAPEVDADRYVAILRRVKATNWRARLTGWPREPRAAYPHEQMVPHVAGAPVRRADACNTAWASL